MTDQPEDPSPPRPTRPQLYDHSIIRALRQEQRQLQFPRPKIVDVGTGTAQLLIRLAEDNRFDNFELIGTDNSPDMLEVARDVIDAANLAERIVVQENDVHDLPYPDQFCEYVTSQSTIHHWKDPILALREIFRVLKPGGVAIMQEPRRDVAPEALVAVKSRLAKKGMSLDSLTQTLTPGEVWDVIEEAGLAANSIINSPSTSTGFEVRIAKAAASGTVTNAPIIRTSTRH